MNQKKKEQIKTIFVDCFNTVVFRKVKRKDVFKNWAIDLSAKYGMAWKEIYKTFMRINFGLCFKKLLTTFTLQEQFEVVLTRLYSKLVKKYNRLEGLDFINTAIIIYKQKELECFDINQNMIDFLKKEKGIGKKIYLVSDFYCKSNIIKEWFSELGIEAVFDEVFSSGDFNKEKATTKLYKELIKKLSLKPGEVIMYGDNFWSDVLMAKSCGLQAKRVKKQRENYE